MAGVLVGGFGAGVALSRYGASCLFSDSGMSCVGLRWASSDLWCYQCGCAPPPLQLRHRWRLLPRQSLRFPCARSHGGEHADNSRGRCSSAGNATTAPAAVVNDPQCVALGMNGGPYPNCNVSGMTPIDSGVATPSGAPAVAAATPVDTSDISTWLNESTLISGVPNMYLAIGSAIAAYFLLKKK